MRIIPDTGCQTTYVYEQGNGSERPIPDTTDPNRTDPGYRFGSFWFGKLYRYLPIVLIFTDTTDTYRYLLILTNTTDDRIGQYRQVSVVSARSVRIGIGSEKVQIGRPLQGMDYISGTNLNIFRSNFYQQTHILLQVKSVTIMVMNPIICRPVSSAEISRHLMDKNRPSSVDKDMTNMTYDKPRKESHQTFYFIFCLIE